MSLFKYTSPVGSFKILHGNDTDVTWLTIIKFANDKYVVTRTFDNEFNMKLEPTTEIWDLAELKRQFKLQYGSPMHYLSNDEYEWLISNDK